MRSNTELLTLILTRRGFLACICMYIYNEWFFAGQLLQQASTYLCMHLKSSNVLRMSARTGASDWLQVLYMPLLYFGLASARICLSFRLP